MASQNRTVTCTDTVTAPPVDARRRLAVGTIRRHHGRTVQTLIAPTGGRIHTLAGGAR